MPQFQLLTGYIHLAGERNNVVYRGPDNPMTYPETLILSVIHGGQEHVHTLVEVGDVERSQDEEIERLTVKYGNVVTSAFPAVAGRVSLPVRDDSLPTAEEVAAAKEAAEAAAAGVREAKAKGKTASKKAKTAEPASAAVPSLTDLASEET